jgi:nitronate monooxygenase
MAGGPSTPELVAAVGAAGGLGFLAAGYLTPEAFAAQLDELHRRSSAAYGLNLFLPSPRRGDPAALAAYGERLRPLAARFGAPLGEPRWDDDAIAAKLDVVCGATPAPAVVSFTFAAPTSSQVERVRAATGAVVAATVTTRDEAREAVGAGVDALVLQGSEAGGHRGVFRDDAAQPAGGEEVGVDALLAAVRDARLGVGLVAAGGLMDGEAIGRVMDAGAIAAQLGTAFLCCPEAGTSAAHRAALLGGTFPGTRITRAFTGRPARGLDNALARDPWHAPAAYPEVHHLTRPLRAAAAAAGDLETPHFWAGTGWSQVQARPAGDIVRGLQADLARAGGPRASSSR